jgi:hypothetical protein
MILKGKMFFPPYDGWSLDQNPFAVKVAVDGCSSTVNDCGKKVEFYVHSLGEWKTFSITTLGGVVYEKDGSGVRDCQLRMD